MARYTVTRITETDAEVESFRLLPTAVRRYQRTLHRHKNDHVILARSEHLPGFRPKVIAERFGGPMRQP